jgi:2-C-methyl-D-erythritol 4-phosphate cytidylyltransferase
MGGADKQLRAVAGIPVLARTVSAFEECADVGAIVLVLNPDNIAAAAEMKVEYGWHKVVVMVPGGERRMDSVRAGLEAVAKLHRHDRPYEWVAVHDGARPLVTPELISRGLDAAREVGAAIAAVPATDTVKTVDAAGTVTGTLQRGNVWLAQTPQIFRASLLKSAYDALEHSEEPVEVTDCARAVELMGHQVRVFKGDRANIKITTPLDLWIAEAIIRSRELGIGAEGC